VNIQLHIERLVIEGLPLAQSQGTRVQAAVEQELSRLFVQGQLSPQLASGGALPAVTGGTIQAGHPASPSGLGANIAGAVFSGIGGQR
jgi:hypothetical protein